MIFTLTRSIFVLVVFICALLMTGCSEPVEVSSQSAVRQKRTRARYPTGVDTVAAWADGRYQIVVDALYDEENKPDPCILRLVRAYLKEGSHVYIRGQNECVVLDVEKLSFEKYPIAQIPARYRSVFNALENGSKDKRVHTLPVINP